jgi:ABC-type transport system substrate-binding protein
MATITFNVALGRAAALAALPAASDALILIPLESSGLEADSVLKDKDDFAAVVAGTTNEQTTVGRKTLSSVTVTVNDTLDRVEIDAADVVWTSPTGNAIGAMVVVYDPDSGTGTDADLIPVTKADVTWSPDGTTFTLAISDFFRAS